MNHKQVEEYVLSMPNTVLDYPFGEEVAVYKVFVPAESSASHMDAAQGSKEEQASRTGGTVSERQTPADAAMRHEPGRAAGSASGQDQAVRGDWKMFALIPEGKDPVRISLKCDPKLSEVLRERYETVMEGYHLNKKHWNTIVLTGQLPWKDIEALINHSYDLVTKSGGEVPTIE
ncbi:MAG: MmcQ/YjbR family DNA-binding protein [Candidatus Saccharibacteria bacterium]|nr:MmcQ/YjbR family DNA-binding protein [Candidatus Saccharibacteria bacterium]